MGFLKNSPLFIVFSFALFIATVGAKKMLKPEAYMTVSQLITEAGYRVEKHRVYTEDGYVLQVHRIPAGRRTVRRTSNEKGKKTVLLNHGLGGSSGDYVIMGPDRSLAYLLADAGYDVWLANYRGTFYSAHKNMTRDNPQFWDFSFHEQGTYDVPATIDMILNVTGLSKIFYIGYSMGMTTFFTMMSERPEYNEKIIACVALAPGTYQDNLRPYVYLTLKMANLTNLIRSRGVYALDVAEESRDRIISKMCSERFPAANICVILINTFLGLDYEQTDWDTAPVIYARFQPMSLRTFEHYGKISLTGELSTWEGGFLKHIRSYNLSCVRVPVSIVYGENDLLAHKSQVFRLAAKLKQTGVLEDLQPVLKWPKFNHFDFIFGRDVGELLNKPLVPQIDDLYNKYGTS